MSSLMQPAVLFFVVGILAGLLRSSLEIPQQISRFLSLYLLMALGLKGGFALAASGFQPEVVITVTIGLILAALIPAVSYVVLTKTGCLGSFDAAAVAGTYGSISAVTFVTASSWLASTGIQYGGHMAAVMALMESPAIVMAVALANKARSGSDFGFNPSTLRESLTDGPNLLLLAALAVGFCTGARGEAMMKPFSIDLFNGLLAFFLLDMGIQVAKRFHELRQQRVYLLLYAIVAPLVHAAIALTICAAAGVSAGNSILLMVLAASASYIAVPAVVRHAIPEANPSIYLGLSLGLTFPFNVLVGIPLYSAMVHSIM